MYGTSTTVGAGQSRAEQGTTTMDGELGPAMAEERVRERERERERRAEEGLEGLAVVS